MEIKLRVPTIRELAKRMDQLEQLIRTTSVHSYNHHASDRSFSSDFMEHHNIQKTKRARDVASRTFGMISKKRGREWLKWIEHGRASGT